MEQNSQILHGAQIKVAELETDIADVTAAEQRATTANQFYQNTNALLSNRLEENSQILHEYQTHYRRQPGSLLHQLEAKSSELDRANGKLQDQTKRYQQAMRCNVLAASSKAKALEAAAHDASLSASSKAKALEAAAHTASLRASYIVEEHKEETACQLAVFTAQLEEK